MIETTIPKGRPKIKMLNSGNVLVGNFLHSNQINKAKAHMTKPPMMMLIQPSLPAVSPTDRGRVIIAVPMVADTTTAIH